MPDSKITALTSIGTGTDPANDPLVIVDVSDVSPGGMSATGTTKKVTLNNLLACSPTATLASATITGDLTVDTSTLKVDSANNRVGIGTASPADTLDVNGRVTALRYLSSSSNAALPSFAVSAGNGAYNSGTNEIGFSINSTSAMTLNSTGLGIGVSPSAKIHIANSSMLIDTYAAQNKPILILGSAGANYGQIQNDAAGLWSLGYGASVSALGTPVLSWNSSGNVSLATGNLVMSTSGKGIDFSATASGSGTMTSELLNDYEEGTWTGTIGGTTGNPTTPVTSTGRYTKIGRQVSVEIGFYGDTTGASSRITVSGLPFTSNAIIARPGAILIDTMGTFTGSPIAFLGSGVTTIELYSSNSNGAISSVTHNAGAGRALYMELTYTV